MDGFLYCSMNAGKATLDRKGRPGESVCPCIRPSKCSPHLFIMNIHLHFLFILTHSWIWLHHICAIVLSPPTLKYTILLTLNPLQRCYSFKYVSPSYLWHPLCSRRSPPNIWRVPLVVRQKFSLGTGPVKGPTLSWTLGGVTQASGAHVAL